MQKGWILGAALLFGVAFFIVAQNERSPEKPSAPTRESRDIAEAAVLRVTAHQLVLAELKDPESAVFNYDLPRHSGLFCGTVRAKNSFGGYGNEIFYILFPFGLVDSEHETQSRFKRLWSLYCFDGTAQVTKLVAPNRFNEVIQKAKGADRAWMLGRIVGGKCSGQISYFMGIGHTKLSNEVAFWSLRCSNGAAYEIGLWPNQPSRVLECRVLEQLHAGKCFRKLS